MIKGNRIEATNTTYVGSHTIVTNMLVIPTGKTFVLTDLMITGSSAVDTNHTITSSLPVKLYDVAGASGTAASGTNVPRLTVNLPVLPVSSFEAAGAFKRGTAVVHFTNGPEFVNGVTPASGDNGVIGTGCVWVAGYIK